LSEETRHERCHSTSRASSARYEADSSGLHISRQQLHQNVGGTRIDGTEEQAQDGNCDSVANDVWHEPDEQLKSNGTGVEDVDKGAFTDSMR